MSYVALPDTPLDPSSAQEGRLIRRGLPYLRAVFRSRHWTVYAVRDPTPLLEGPGRLTSLGHDSFALRATSAGQVPRARALHPLLDAHRRQRPRRGGARGVDLRDCRMRPGQLRVTARFSLARVLG